MAKYNVVFVLGGPGAGKGTQCERIVKTFGFTHLSAGDLLREERASGSKNGDLIENYIKNGQIVPVEITIELLRAAMEKSGKQDFLIDGFPRNKDNLDGWFRVMDGVANVKFVLYFECTEEECLERCMKRGETSGRSDDNIESFRKRYKTYVESTQPIIQYFEAKGLVRSVSSGPPADEVFEAVKAVFQNA